MPEPVTLADVKARLVGVGGWLSAAAALTPAYNDATIEAGIPASIRRFEREMAWRVKPVQVVCKPDGTYTGSASVPLVEEDPVAFWGKDAEAWFTVTLRERPVRQVQRARVYLGTENVLFEIPVPWLVVDRLAGRLRVVPVRGGVITTGIDVGYSVLMHSFRNYSHLPGSVAIDYQAGLPDGWQDTAEWSDLRRTLAEFHAAQVLDDISELFDAGMLSIPVSADGLSQSAQYERFVRRRQELRDSVARSQDALRGTVGALLMTVI